jgi:YD repeat-containing protein
VEDALGRVTQTQYDKLGNVTNRIDPLLRETSFQYDALDRVLIQTDPLGGLTSYEYDGPGKLAGAYRPQRTYNHDCLR